MLMAAGSASARVSVTGNCAHSPNAGYLVVTIDTERPDGTPITSVSAGRTVIVSVHVSPWGYARRGTVAIRIGDATATESFDDYPDSALIGVPNDYRYETKATQVGELRITAEAVEESPSCGARVLAEAVLPVFDASPPGIAFMNPASAKPGKRAVLRYTITEGSGQTREAIAIYRAGSSKPDTTFTTQWSDPGIREAGWRIPSRYRPGRYTWCVVSTDAFDNVSKPKCARLTVLR